MMNTTAPVAVVGATGQQGSATVDALLDRGIPVRALTRNTDGASARALAERGVEVVSADLAAPETVRRAFDGAAAVFAMTTFGGPDGTDGEVAQGKVISDAAQAAGLPFLLFSSVGGAERHSGIPHFESKGRIEALLSSGVPLNIVRPTFFMENLLHMIGRDGDEWSVRLPLPGDVPLQMISVRDIGKAAAALLASRDPEAAPVEIAGDELTGEQITERLGRRLGARARFVELPLEALGDDEDSKAMFQWFTKLPAYRAHFERTRELVPDVEDLATWLQRQSLG
jgi:uncharacterized protein YbjT (DUF2867 family)